MDRPQSKAEMIAPICHAANKAWCEANGDYTQKGWNEAEQWQRDSAVKGVEFRMNNPDAGHDAQHNAWMAEKVADGWVYGPKKDPEAKTHPCIVPFDQLPEHQQKKDALFCAIVDAFAGSAKTTGLNFGEAIKALKRGKRVAREGWNGQGMFLVLSPGKKQLPAADFFSPQLREYAEKVLGGHMDVRLAFMLKTAQDDVAYWAPSGSDALAKDWVILD